MTSPDDDVTCKAECDCGAVLAIDPVGIEREGLTCPACGAVLAEADDEPGEAAGDAPEVVSGG